MTIPRKMLALAAGSALALSAAALSTATLQAQQPSGARSASGDVVQDPDASVEFIQKSEVAPLIEGNLESVELEIGKTVEKNGTIGKLYSTKAELTVKKAQVAAKSTGAIKKAMAQKDQAISVVSRNRRMIARDPLLVPKEDLEKAEAELGAAIAMIQQAQEEQELARAELALAQNNLDEHTIRAPFSGVILKWLKKPGESISAREPVLQLGNLDRLRVFAYLPIEAASRVREGMTVEFQPKGNAMRGGMSPIEGMKFRGVISFVDPQIQPINETAVRIYAEFPNPNHLLRPGYKGTLTVFLNAAEPVPSARNDAPAPSPAPTSTAADLPPLPR